MSRSFKINKNAYYYVRSERVNWLDQFADNIEKASKTAVEIARERNQSSIYDQINSIMNNNSSNHRTVESIVKDMQERVGINKYLQNKSNDNSKVAQKSERLIPEIPANLESDIINFIDNTAKTHLGLIAVPAVWHETVSSFKNEGLNDEHLNESILSYINKAIARERKLNPSKQTSVELGKGVGVDMDVDDADTDFMHNMMPAK